jgi:prepilin-type processing-associated H-X9-DG protein
MKSNQLLFCPSDSNAKSSNPPQPNNNISYGWNAYYLAVDHTAWRGGGVNIATINSVSQTVLLADTHADTFSRYQVDPNYATYRPIPRHLEGANVAFVDGHVKWYSKDNDIFSTSTLWDLN